MKWFCIAVLAAILVLLAFGCAGPQATPAPTPVAKTATGPVAVDSWQQKWDKLVAEGKKEEKVMVNYSGGATVREALNKAFSEKYGIALEFNSGKPAEVAPRVQRERSAGLYLSDVFLAGIGTVVSVLGPDGALEPLDEALVLPEVKDPKSWLGGKLIWGDEQHRLLMYLAYALDPLNINTDIVKPEDMKSYRNLLDAKWKGKISFLDPRMAGGGNSAFTFWHEALGIDFLRDLAKQEPIFTRNVRLQVEWLARGKYPLGIGVNPGDRTEFTNAGAPVRTLRPVEGTVVTGGSGGILILNKAPHPNAAKVFINWLLSRDGVTVMSRATGTQSARVDVPTDFLEADTVLPPGAKYFSLMSPSDEEKKRDNQKLAGEIFKNLME